MTATAERMTTKELVERLRRHYVKPGAFPGGVFAHEVGTNGAGTTRRCDALWVGFTSTSGRLLTGHEVKVSRSDWRHELDQPHKASDWADQCHAWYVVAANDAVKPEELPPGWGLMVPNPRTRIRLDVVVKAKVDADRVPAWWAVRSLLARLDTLGEQRIADRVESTVASRIKEHADRADSFERLRTRDRDALAERLASALATHRVTDGRTTTYVTDEQIEQALVDLLLARSTAEHVRHALVRSVQALQGLVAPLADTMPELRALLADHERNTRT